MKKYSLITTFYDLNAKKPSINEVKSKLNYDGFDEDIYINFSNNFSPHDFNSIPNIGISRRRDLIYGKIFLLKDFILENILNKYEYVCHVDFSDVKFNKSFLDMMRFFENKKIDFIISTEKNAWPFIQEIEKWTGYNIIKKEFEFLNSGALISKTNVLIKYLQELEKLCLNSNIDFWDDQGVWQYYDFKIENLNKDTKTEFFFSTALLDETYYHIVDGVVRTKFGHFPYILHDNSSFNLNLIQKI